MKSEKNISKNIVRILKERNITRCSFCLLVDMHETHLSRICNGKAIPQIGKIIKMANALNLKVDDLIS